MAADETSLLGSSSLLLSADAIAEINAAALPKETIVELTSLSTNDDAKVVDKVEDSGKGEEKVVESEISGKAERVKLRGHHAEL